MSNINTGNIKCPHCVTNAWQCLPLFSYYYLLIETGHTYFTYMYSHSERLRWLSESGSSRAIVMYNEELFRAVIIHPTSILQHIQMICNLRLARLPSTRIGYIVYQMAIISIIILIKWTPSRNYFILLSMNENQFPKAQWKIDALNAHVCQLWLTVGLNQRLITLFYKKE